MVTRLGFWFLQRWFSVTMEKRYWISPQVFQPNIWLKIGHESTNVELKQYIFHNGLQNNWRTIHAIKQLVYGKPFSSASYFSNVPACHISFSQLTFGSLTPMLVFYNCVSLFEKHCSRLEHDQLWFCPVWEIEIVLHCMSCPFSMACCMHLITL